MDEKILVIKRDGSKEPFDPEKISRVTLAAGLNQDQVQLLSRKLTLWASSLGTNEISSLDIRDQVLNELESIDENVARFFRWYQKTKDTPHS